MDIVAKINEATLARCLIKSRGGVYCETDKRDCMRCGWNYEVEKQREDKLFGRAEEKDQDAN